MIKEMESKTNLDEGNVKINTNVSEEFDEEKFKEIFHERSLEAQKIEGTILKLKHQLKEIEPDEELLKFVDMLEKAQELNRQKEITKKLKSLEESLSREKKILESWKTTHDELKNKE